MAKKSSLEFGRTGFWSEVIEGIVLSKILNIRNEWERERKEGRKQAVWQRYKAQDGEKICTRESVSKGLRKNITVQILPFRERTQWIVILTL